MPMVETININVELEKSKILDILKEKGPSVSNAIAKTLNIQSYVAAALLSELLYEKLIKASNIRMGGSPLYYLEGQDEQLEKFSNFMNHKEKEAFALLKNKGILVDSETEPAIRVAIRNVKDFAIPLKINKGKEEILLWKYKFLKNSDEKIEEIAKGKKEIKAIEKLENKSEIVISEAKEIKEKPKKEKSSSDGLLQKWAEENNVAVNEVILSKGKDLKAKVKISSKIGDLDFLAILKNKKSVNEADLSMAYQEGLNLKMPVIFLTNGKLSKQVQAYIVSLGSSLVVRKL